MSTVAVLGLGLLGSGFAERLVAAGHTVRVWNRSPARCAPLAALGAVVAATPAEAVAGVERVHLILAEDTAVDAVLAQLLPGLGVGVPIVDHSTNLPERVAARAARFAADGVRYLHAPVFMAPSNARAATGLMLVSGPRDLVLALTPALATMTGKVIDLGDAPERGAVLKLVGNGLLIGTTALMGDLFRVAAGAGVAPADVLALFETFTPSAVGAGARALRAGQGPVGFELTMARKDTRLMIETAGGPERLAVLPAVAAAMDAAIGEGHGAEDYAVFARP